LHFSSEKRIGFSRKHAQRFLPETSFLTSSCRIMPRCFRPLAVRVLARRTEAVHHINDRPSCQPIGLGTMLGQKSLI
jgi:hypothetical protein